MQKTPGKRIRSSYLTSIVSISLVLFMIGLFGILMLDAKKISDFMKEHVQLNVFLDSKLSEAEISTFQSLLERQSYTKSAVYISKDEALERLKEELGENAVDILEENPLHPSFELRLNAAYAHPDSVTKISTALQQNKMVYEITYQKDELTKMTSNIRTIGIIILVFCALLFIVAVALINNTIRIELYSRRFLIKSMQLVGATRGFVRRPFVLKGMRNGLYSGLIACILLISLIYFYRQRFPELTQLHSFEELSILMGVLILFGIVLSLLSTYFSVNRFLRLRIAELYS